MLTYTKKWTSCKHTFLILFFLLSIFFSPMVSALQVREEYYENALPLDIYNAIAGSIGPSCEIIDGYRVDDEEGFVFLLLHTLDAYRIYIVKPEGSAWKLSTISEKLPILNNTSPHLYGESSTSFVVEYASFLPTDDENGAYYCYTFERELDNLWALASYTVSTYSKGNHYYAYAASAKPDGITVSLFSDETAEDAQTEEYTFYGKYERQLENILLLQLPDSLQTAALYLNTSNIAMVNNPSVDKRLHLRNSPSKEGTSIGRYNNGTIVTVLEKTNDEWTKVQIGEAEGYMMDIFLSYGNNIASVALPSAKQSIHASAQNSASSLYSRPLPSAEIVTELPDSTAVKVLGVVDDEWSHVMLNCGISGYVKSSSIRSSN